MYRRIVSKSTSYCHELLMVHIIHYSKVAGETFVKKASPATSVSPATLCCLTTLF